MSAAVATATTAETAVISRDVRHGSGGSVLAGWLAGLAGDSRPRLRYWGSRVGDKPTAFATEIAFQLGIVYDVVRSGSESATATLETKAWGRGAATGMLRWWWWRRGPAGETQPKQEAKCFLLISSLGCSYEVI